MALSEGRRLAELIRKMLTLSRPEEEERQATSLSELLDDLLLFVERQMRERGIAIESDLPPDLPPALVSGNQMKQVFLNLLQNSRDAMPSGGTLKVSVGERDGKLEVKVSDTGIGISAKHLPQVFHAFFTTKQEFRGVGLGLNVCYGIVKDHGGEIEVQSEVGKGTTFTVRLPAAGTPTGGDSYPQVPEYGRQDNLRLLVHQSYFHATGISSRKYDRDGIDGPRFAILSATKYLLGRLHTAASVVRYWPWRLLRPRDGIHVVSSPGAKCPANGI